MGKALADQFEICAQTFAEADAALGESLSDLIFNGPTDRLTLTENTQPAILTMSIAVWRLLDAARADAVVCRRAQPRRVLGARRGGHAGSLPMPCGWCATAAATCRKPCRSASGAMAAILGLDEAGVTRACEEAAAGRSRQPREPQWRRPDRDCRHRRRGGAGRRARQGARRQARDSAAR